MVDDPLPTGVAAATPYEFAEIAESAGLLLKDPMEKHMESGTITSGFEPILMEPHQDALKLVMEHFEASVSRVYTWTNSDL